MGINLIFDRCHQLRCEGDLLSFLFDPLSFLSTIFLSIFLQ